MITVQVPIQGESSSCYPVWIGQRIIEALPTVVNLSSFSRVAVLIDENIQSTILPRLLASFPSDPVILSLRSTEQSKSMSDASQLLDYMASAGLDRRSLLLNVGGGVIGDLGGFVASIYMRGISFLQIPTTLLSQVDASVGGKVGINHHGIKNLIGSFQQPLGVLIDLDTLSSLPQREYRSGWAEIIKHALIADRDYLAEIAKQASTFTHAELLLPLIERSVQIKSMIVSADEKEMGKRKLLNFGHTIGHAVESLSHEMGTPLLHGEAVSIGMCGEAKLSCLLKLLSKQEVSRIESLLQQFSLPVRIPFSCTIDSLMEKIRSDKKNERGEVHWSLLQTIGEGVYDQIAPLPLIHEALQYISL